MSKYRSTVYYDLKFRFLVIFPAITGTVWCWKIPFLDHIFSQNLEIPCRKFSFLVHRQILRLPLDFKPGYSVSGKRLHYIIHQDNLWTKNSKFYKNAQEANCSRGFGIKADIEERGNKKNSTCWRGVFVQLIPSGEKDGGYCLIINLKMLH